jgi:putative ABC transport system substrate-binding protein
MKKAFVGLAFSAVLLALSFPSEAQQPKKIPRIGIAGTSEPGSEVEAFRQGLKALGYIEGKNILFEYRFAGGKRDRLPGLVAELVQLKVDVLLPVNLPAVRAAKEATKTIPVVMVLAVDPVATGIVDSLAHPGGNITGLSRLMRDLSGKRLELLRDVVPKIARVGILWEPDAAGPAIAFKEYEAAARALKIQLRSLEVRGPNPDLEGAFKAAVKGRATGLIAIRSNASLRYSQRIADLAIKNRLASMHEAIEFVEAGGLSFYGANDADLFRRAAVYVDKILKGTKPADLPVEQPMKFEFVINLKTAKQIGLTIPQWTLMRADRVIR